MPRPIMPIDMSLKYGLWTPKKRMGPKMLCACDCGTEKIINAFDMKSGKSTNCGCRKKILLSKRLKEKNPSRLASGEARKNNLLYSYRDAAMRRGLSWSLSRDEFIELILAECHYCGTSPKTPWKPSKVKFNGELLYNGVDRKNNSIGYTAKNCVPCCSWCNNSKHTKSYAEFIGYISRNPEKFARSD